MQSKKPKIRTMAELATRVGLSRPTLSKFFQDSGSVRETTRLRIEAELEAVDYTPNFFATKLNRKSTGLIGVIVPYLSDLFFTSLIEAMEARALQSDYMVITQTAHGDPQLEARAAQNLMSMSVDGVIVAPIGELTSLDMISRLKDEMPLVFVDSRFPNDFQDVDFIGTNNQQSISLIVDYLCRSGEPPAFLGMPRINSNSLEREQAYLYCARQADFEADVIPGGVDQSGWEFERYAYEVMDEHFSRGRYVERSILCANDRLAMGCVRAANRHKLFTSNAEKAPRCRIAGHDNHPLSAYIYPGLTTVSRDTVAMGVAAVEQVIHQISCGQQGGPGVTRMFDAELCLRESA